MAISPQASKKILSLFSKAFSKNSLEKAVAFPSRQNLVVSLEQILNLVFPGYFEPNLKLQRSKDVLKKIATAHENLTREIYKALTWEKKLSGNLAEKKAAILAEKFLSYIPTLRAQLDLDIAAIYEGDPAAKSHDEVILAYPGLQAIAVYRIAHFLYLNNIPLIPRMMTEIVHSITGVDIHPGAKIGSYFCIDHGTGIVIGETTVIGDHVKLYQGVTLGALSVPKRDKSGKKRHPTLEDNVTVYARTTILGGDTVVGENSIIGGNVWITESVPANSKIYLNTNKRHIVATRKTR